MGKKKNRSSHDHEHLPNSLYEKPQDFLDQVSIKIDAQSAIYQCVESHLYATINIDSEYVVIVLKIMDPQLRQFYGGQYLIQQWTKKRKLFQAVHTAKPNKFHLYKQRFIYSLSGTQEECQWLYVVNFYQEVYNKIRHPFFSLNNENSEHELQLFVDAKLMFVAFKDRLMWAPFKFEEGAGGERDSVSRQSVADSVDQSAFGNKNGSNEDETNHVSMNSTYAQAQMLETSFKSVFASLDGEAPDFLQILDIGNEGYQQKEINVIFECETKVVIYQVQPKKLRKFTVFKLVEKHRFDKTAIGLQFRELIHSIRIVNISEAQSVYLMTKGQGELQILTDKDYEAQIDISSTLRRLTIQNAAVGQGQDFNKPNQIAPEEGDDEFFSKADAIIKLQSYFARRGNIYLIDIAGAIKRLNVNDCKLPKPLKRAAKILESRSLVELQELSMHLGFFSDYLVANTAILISHGKILSIFDFKMSKWSHILPNQQGNQNRQDYEATYKQTYFGMPDEEIHSLILNHVFKNSIYDFLVQYNNTNLRRLKYFNDCQKTCFEKAVIFKGQKVRQIVKNADMQTYRKYGDIVERTYFLIQNTQTKLLEVWVSENGSKMTKLIRNIKDKWVILNLQNAQSDQLAVHEPAKKTLTFYSIQNVKQCLDTSELSKFVKLQIDGVTLDDKIVNYFCFGHKLFYAQEGNLIQWDLMKKVPSKAKKEYNFKSTIKDFYMTDATTIYYKDNNIFRFADIRVQKKFDLHKLPTKIVECKGAFLGKLDYSFTSNRFSFFSGPFEVSIIPGLHNYSIDLMSTMNFESNFVFWKQIENKLHSFKSPNTIVTWNLDTGQVDKSSEQKIYIKGFKKHSEWNGCTLLKLVRDASTGYNIDEDYPPDSSEFEEEKRARQQYPKKHLFSLVDIDAEGEIKEICRFLYEHKIGQALYVAFPYLLIMDDEYAKFYSLEGKDPKFKVMKSINAFYESQMKIGKPTYFSPNFHHRIIQAPDSDDLVLNYTLTNQTLCTLAEGKTLLWQKPVSHPMIYFHNDEQIVCMTQYGIEKVFQIVKHIKRKKTTVELKEVANMYFTERDLVRRVLYDAYSFKREMVCQIQHVHMLQIRASIIKRGLLLNEYLLDRVEQKKNNIQREYPDANIGNFSYFIVDNYRRELNFSYMSWKIIEQIANKKLSIDHLRKEFVTQLVFTILPNQETILHYLNDNFEELQNFLKIINEEAPVLQGAKTKQIFDVNINDVPFLPNLKGKTPLHKAIDLNNTRFTDKMVTVLADTDFDHHSRFLVDKFHKLVDQVPQAFLYYLEQRQKTTVWIEKYTRGKIEPVPECEFIMASNQIWSENIDETIQEKMYTPEIIEKPMTMSILDLPNAQKFQNKFADKLIEVLSETNNIEIFETASVRAIIELKWPLVKQAMVKYLFYPYLLQLFCFIIYSVYIFEHMQENKEEFEDVGFDLKNPQFWIINQKLIIKIIILCTVTYFFSLEFRAFVTQGPVKYLQNPWNYVDFIPLSLITFSLFFEWITSEYPKLERAINSISLFLLWIKFLYFLRMYRQSSKFISTIVAGIADLKVFMAVFVVSLITFSQSMYIISNNNAEEDRFIHDIWDSLLFTYNISLGSWDVTAMGSSDKLIIMTLFILSTLFLQIIMLNLIIAVISDTYARVEGTSQNELYKNFSDLIMENEYLVPASQIAAHDDAGTYLYIAKIDENEVVGGDAMEGQLNELKNTITQRVSVLDRVAQELVRTLSSTLQQSSDRFTQIYLEDQLRGELTFKQQMKRMNAGSHGREGSFDSPDMRRGISEFSPPREDQQQQRKTLATQKGGHKSGRTGSGKRSDTQVDKP